METTGTLVVWRPQSGLGCEESRWKLFWILPRADRIESFKLQALASGRAEVLLGNPIRDAF